MHPRYARLTLVLVLVALIPTVVNSYLGSVEDTGPGIDATVPTSLLGLPSSPTGRREASMQRNFAPTDWIERRYALGDTEVTLVVARSFDMKRLYHHPELAVASGMNYRAPRLETLPAEGGDLHAHVLEGENTGLVAYTLLYGDATIARPLLFQLQVAPELLLRGRRPMTLVLALDRNHVPRDGDDVTEAPAVAMLRPVVEALREAAR